MTARGQRTAGLGGGGGHATAGRAPSWPRRAGRGKVTRAGYSRPESSDVGRSAYGSARGRGTHGEGGEGRGVRAPAGGRAGAGSGRAEEESPFTVCERARLRDALRRERLWIPLGSGYIAQPATFQSPAK